MSVGLRVEEEGSRARQGRQGIGIELCSMGNKAPGSSCRGFHNPPEKRGP